MILTMLGPIIPEMRAHYGLSLADVAPLFLYQGVGFFLAVLIGGRWADRAGRRPVLIAGAGMLTAAFLSFGLSPGWGQTLLLFTLAWAGFGLSEAALNSLTVDLGDGDAGRSLNILHLFAALGAVIGPFFTHVLQRHFGWTSPLMWLGVLFGVFLLLTWTSPFPLYRALKTPTKPTSMVEMIKSPILIMTALALALYVGAEGAISGWSVTYIVTTLASSPFLGALVTSLFWLGLMVGRAACARVTTRFGYLRLVTWIGLGTVFAYLPVLFASSIGSTTLFTFATGVLMGGIFPTLVAHACKNFPLSVGSVTGVLIASGSVGGAVIPAVVAATSDRFGMRWGFLGIVISCVGMVTMTWSAQKTERKTQYDDPIPKGAIGH